MPKPKTLALMSASADELEAAFYEALNQGDLDQLMTCWADEDDIVYIHPSGARMLGAVAIRAAFDAMLAHGSIRAQPERVRRLTLANASVHSVVERIEMQTDEGPQHVYVMVTNVYHHTAQGWRMVAHHASPGTANDLQDMSDKPETLH